MTNYQKIHQIPKWYVDFFKVEKNLKKYQRELQKLKQVILLPNLKRNLFNLVRKELSFLELLFLMIGQRWKSFRMKEDWNIKSKLVDDKAYWDCNDKSSVFFSWKKWEEIYFFLSETGLIDLLLKSKIQYPGDYLFGVEVGLNSNACKNPTGKIMEEMVEDVLLKKKQNKEILWYEKEKKVTDLAVRVGFSSKKISFDQVSDRVRRKVFDFIFCKNSKIYLLECNYYNAGGSKIDTIINDYQSLAKQTPSFFQFIWISGGPFWEEHPQYYQKAKKIKHFLLLKDFRDF